MKKVCSLCLAMAIITALCAFVTSCSNFTVGLTLPSAVTTSFLSDIITTGTTSTTAATTAKTKPTTATTKMTDISERLPSPTTISQITFLDFRPEMNKWADRDENGDLLHTGFTDNEMTEKNGQYYYPHALYLEKNGYNKNLNFSFKENGETIKLTATNAENPGIAFEFANSNVYPIGIENQSNIQFIKIRFKNNSSATKLTLMGMNLSYANGNLDPRVRATIAIEPNSSEWQTITINMYDEVFNTTGNKNWNSRLKKFGIFPFGYGNDCQAYKGAEMEIDYVVLGSYDYVTSYQSELEKSAS